MSEYNTVNLSAAKIAVTDLLTAANITAAKVGCTGTLTCTNLYVQGTLDLIQGNLGVSGFVDAKVDYVPISTSDNLLKDNLLTGFAASINEKAGLSGGDTANQVVVGSTFMFNGQLLSGNAFTGEDAPTQLFGLAGSTGLYVSENSYYRNLSSTKLLGALVTAKAFEEGIVDIDDPVYKYLGGLTGPAGELPPAGNGWLAKENCKVLTWTSYGETGYGLTGGITTSTGGDLLYESLSGVFSSINGDTTSPFYGTIPKAGDTGMWGLAPCDTNITVRHLLSMSAGLVVDNFYGGGLLFPSLFHNPKITHTKLQKGYYESGVGATGYIGGWGTPYICGGTGALPTSDNIYFNSINSLSLTHPAVGVTGTILMYQPGTESYYGNEYDALGPVLHYAIKQKNADAQTYAGTTFAYVYSTFGPTSAEFAGVSTVLLSKGVWSSAALELGSTALIGAIVGATFSISSLVVDDIVDYICVFWSWSSYCNFTCTC